MHLSVNCQMLNIKKKMLDRWLQGGFKVISWKNTTQNGRFLFSRGIEVYTQTQNAPPGKREGDSFQGA